MSNSWIPKAVFLMVALVALWQGVTSFSAMPDRVASHFAASGLPNGWMTKEAFFIVYGVMVLLAAVIEVYPARSIARSPSRIHLPNKEYWLAPERRAATYACFEEYLAWYGCVFLLVEVLAMGLAIQANLNPAPRLSRGPIGMLVVGFLAFNIAFVVQLLRRFSKPK
jgi:uncharacterized membrane protein